MTTTPTLDTTCTGIPLSFDFPRPSFVVALTVISEPNKSSISSGTKMQNTWHTGLGPQYNNNSWFGTQYNYNGTGQNINHVGTEIDSRKILWDAIQHVGFSHNAEQQCSRGECLEGTREEVLRIIHNWRIPNCWEPPICWLSGAAGVGKTSIAMTIAKSCERDGLIESFFFFRLDANRNHPSVLMLAITHGLAVAHPSVREEIDNRIKADPSILGARFEVQFKELVLQPLAKSCARQIAANPCFRFNGPTLVIIDGLDECGDEETQKRILSTISSAYQQYPRLPLRFLICSRPEAWIREAFEQQPLFEATKLVLLDEKFEPAKDIERYYTHEFQGIRRLPEYRSVQFPKAWPSRQDLKALVLHSDGQFAYASTAVRFVKAPFSNPLDQLRLILTYTPGRRRSGSPFPSLDFLYRIILNINPYHHKILPILAAIVILPIHIKYNPSPEFIELLLGLSPGDVSLTLRASHSVLDIRGHNDEITVYHTSFRDFLVDKKRSEDFFIDKSKAHHYLVQQWLEALSSRKINVFSRVSKPHIRAFFSRWSDLCSPLIRWPALQLLASLWNLDFSALFFGSLHFLLQNAVTVTRVGYSNKFSVTHKDNNAWHQYRLYKWMQKGLESDTNRWRLYNMIRERFKNHPKCFLFQVDCDNIGIEGMEQAVRSIRRSQLEYQVTPQECQALWKYRRNGKSPLLIRITKCYCHHSGTWESTSYYPQVDRPLDHIREPTCLPTIQKLVFDLCLIDLSQTPGPSKDDKALYRILEDMLDHLPLQHCAFEPELFSLGDTFFSHASRCTSVVMTFEISEARRTRLTEWLETCPKSYAREADTLRFKLNLFFSAFSHAPGLLLELDSFYDNMLSRVNAAGRLLSILGTTFILANCTDPSPAIIELLLGLSRGEVVRNLQPISGYLGFDIHGWEDRILVYRDSLADYLFDRTRSKIFHLDRGALHHWLMRRWVKVISWSRFERCSLDQLSKSSTRILLTGWTTLCTAYVTPTPGLLEDLRNFDVSVPFFCTQVALARTWREDIAGSYDPTWNGIFGGLVSWLESKLSVRASVNTRVIERFRRPPNYFHLQVSSNSSQAHYDIDIMQTWAILCSTCHQTDSELTRRAKKAFSEYAMGAKTLPPPVRITSCDCYDPESTTHPDHCAYQTACLRTVKALVAGYCSYDPMKPPYPSDHELYSILRNLLDSLLLRHCAFGPELFSLCHAFISAIERRPPPWLSRYGWTTRRACLLQWLQTCPNHYAAEAEALKAHIMTVFPEGTL